MIKLDTLKSLNISGVIDVKKYPKTILSLQIKILLFVNKITDVLKRSNDEFF